MKKLMTFALAAAMTLAMSMSAMASDNAILASLESQGVQVQQIANADMDEIRGAALISYQPTPSVTQGHKTHQVSWKGFGSKADYRSYQYVGSGYSPNEKLYYQYQGGTYRIAGDEWLADDVSGPQAWNRAYSYLKEYHFQVIDDTTGAVSPFAFRETAWNRPISTFRW